MDIIAVGVNHRDAPVVVREHLAFTSAQMDAALTTLASTMQESVLLSTCNRTEIYAVDDSAEDGRDKIVRFLSGFHRVPIERFSPYLYSLTGRESVAHLFQVACGLDSMILGEAQILGQVRDACTAAMARGNAGPLLSWVFLHALKAGKRVRTNTEIGRSAVSVSHAAVELARKTLGTLTGKIVLLVGAGEVAELAAKNLAANGAGGLVVVNRTCQRAEELAARYSGSAHGWGELPQLLAEADVAISSTGAPSFIIGPETLAIAASRSPARPLLLIDIAVPRDVDPAVTQIPGVHLRNIDDLQSLCAENMIERRRAAEKARGIIAEELIGYDAWRSGLQVVPTIKALRGRAEEIRQLEMEKALRRLGDLSEKQRSTVEAMTVAIVNKMLHQPTVRLKGNCSDRDRVAFTWTLRELFDLTNDIQAPASVLERSHG